MAEDILYANPRQTTGKGPNRRRRAEGIVPAVLYGDVKATRNLELESAEFERLVHGGAMARIIDLRIKDDGGAEQKAVIHDVQRDPVTHKLIHVDLLRVAMDREITAFVEVVASGAPIGVREGGIFERPTRELEIRCLPAFLPEKIEVDVSNLRINESIHASQAPLSEGVHLISSPETVLFHVAIPRAVEAETPAAEGEVKEPELIGEKKKKEEAEGKE